MKNNRRLVLLDGVASVVSLMKDNYSPVSLDASPRADEYRLMSGLCQELFVEAMAVEIQPGSMSHMSMSEESLRLIAQLYAVHRIRKSACIEMTALITRTFLIVEPSDRCLAMLEGIWGWAGRFNPECVIGTIVGMFEGFLHLVAYGQHPLDDLVESLPRHATTMLFSRHFDSDKGDRLSKTLDFSRINLGDLFLRVRNSPGGTNLLRSFLKLARERLSTRAKQTFSDVGHGSPFLWVRNFPGQMDLRWPFPQRAPETLSPVLSPVQRAILQEAAMKYCGSLEPEELVRTLFR